MTSDAGIFMNRRQVFWQSALINRLFSVVKVNPIGESHFLFPRPLFSFRLSAIKSDSNFEVNASHTIRLFLTSNLTGFSLKSAVIWAGRSCPWISALNCLAGKNNRMLATKRQRLKNVPKRKCRIENLPAAF
jgi:hypothetical protein